MAVLMRMTAPTPVDFWEMMCISLELWGNGYAEIRRRNDRSILSLTPVRPEFMAVDRASSGALRYRWQDDDDQHEVLEDRMLHIRGFGGHPLGGMSTITWNSNAFGTAQAIERAAGVTFRNGVRSSGVLMSEQRLTPEQMAQVEKVITEKYAGAMNAGRPLLLNSDMKWQPISFNPEEAQMLESRGFSVEEIWRQCKWPIRRPGKPVDTDSGLRQPVHQCWYHQPVEPPPSMGARRGTAIRPNHRTHLCCTLCMAGGRFLFKLAQLSREIYFHRGLW